MDMKSRINNLFYISIVCVGIVVYGMHLRKESAAREVAREDWRNVACPSLFSIARSWRDSLIVMKMEPDCNRYIIDTFK